MSFVSVSANEFSAALHHMVETHTALVEEQVDTQLNKAATAAHKQLRSWTWKNATGHYNRGWTVYRYGSLSCGKVGYMIANKSASFQSHLLERGHHLVYYGHQTHKRVPAYPHVKPTYDMAVSMLLGGLG